MNAPVEPSPAGLNFLSGGEGEGLKSSTQAPTTDQSAGFCMVPEVAPLPEMANSTG